MANCINRNSLEYQSLKNKAGIHESLFDIIYEEFQDQHGRSPRLDEISMVDSSKYIKNILKLDKNNSTKIDHVLDLTNSNTIEEAIIKLNNEYLDKEISILPIIEDCIVDIKTRPTDGYPNFEETYIPDKNPNGVIIIEQALHKLANLYGIKVNTVTNAELSMDKWKHLMPQDRLVNAFIYNGDIYINTDKASPDSFIHEMLHLLVGSMRFTNSQLYTSLISQAESFPNYERLLSDYSGKTRNDANEEIFIQEISKYFSGMNSDLNGLDPEIVYEINYNVRRVLDSILMGAFSTKTLSDKQLYNSSFKNVTQAVGSPIMTSTFTGTMNVEGSALHRKLNNMKSDLLKRKILEEVCE